MGIRLTCRSVRPARRAVAGPLIACIGLLLPLAAGAWEARAPVLSAEPVYAAARQRACPVATPGPVAGTSLAGQLAADLEAAACREPIPVLLGWNVTYRFDGRTLRMFAREHPGDYVSVGVSVRRVADGLSGRRRPSP
jgi:hypothetical protein